MSKRRAADLRPRHQLRWASLLLGVTFAACGGTDVSIRQVAVDVRVEGSAPAVDTVEVWLRSAGSPEYRVYRRRVAETDDLSAGVRVRDFGSDSEVHQGAINVRAFLLDAETNVLGEGARTLTVLDDEVIVVTIALGSLTDGGADADTLDASEPSEAGLP